METQLLSAFHGAYDLSIEFKLLQYAQKHHFFHMRCVKFLHYLCPNRFYLCLKSEISMLTCLVDSLAGFSLKINNLLILRVFLITECYASTIVD